MFSGAGARGAKASYSYPILDRREILKALAEMGFSGLTDEILLKPTAEVIWPLYENLVICLMDITREEIQQPILGALECLKFESLYDEATCVKASVRAITRLMFSSGAIDFASRDIFRPDPIRTARFLSAVINFAMFRLEREQTVADVEEKNAASQEIYQQNQQIYEKLVYEITQKEAERQAEQPLVEVLEKETKQLEGNISNLNKTQAHQKNEIRTIKDELNNCIEKITSEKSLLAQKKQEGFQLKTQIVQSPDKLQKMLHDKKIAFENAEVAAETARESCTKWKAKLESYIKAKKKVTKCQDMIDLLEKQIALQKRTAKELKDLRAKLKSNEEKDWEVNAQLAELKLEGQHFQELLDNLESTADAKKNKADRECEEFKLQTGSGSAHLQKLRTAIARVEMEINALAEKIPAIIAETEARSKEAEEDVERLWLEGDRYNLKLIEAMDCVSDLLGTPKVGMLSNMTEN